MRCIICHGDDIQPANTQEELRIEKNIVRVPIHVLVCLTCGERYYDRRTIRSLEEVRKEIQAGKSNLQEIGKILAYG